VADAAIDDHKLARYRRWRDNSAVYFRWQVEQFTPFIGKRVADIGCGPGTLTPYLADRELYLAVDSDPQMLRETEVLRGEFPNLQILLGDVTQIACRDELKRASIDTIVSANTIEHIENDRLALEMMTDALPPGGHLCLLVPAFQALYGTLDRLDGHYRRYTAPVLRERLEGLPLTIRRLRYFNSLGALGWWLKGRVLKAKVQEESDYRLMGLAVPFLRPLEAAIPQPFGLSLIAVMERQHG
jgi:SAM-dependent methyltransferase